MTQHLVRMQIDNNWAYHRKVRRLQRLYPERWPIYWCAYMALLGEAWKARTRRLTIEDAWCPTLPCPPAEATAALVAAGVTDKAGRIPAASWAQWYGPVAAALEVASEKGRAGADARWGQHRIARALPTHSPGNARGRDRREGVAPTRARGNGISIEAGPTQAGDTLRAMGFYPPGEQPRKETP